MSFHSESFLSHGGNAAATADGKGWDVDSVVNQSGAVCCSVLCLLVCIDVMKDVTEDVLGKIVVILLLSFFLGASYSALLQGSSFIIFTVYLVCHQGSHCSPSLLIFFRKVTSSQSSLKRDLLIVSEQIKQHFQVKGIEGVMIEPP